MQSVRAKIELCCFDIMSIEAANNASVDSIELCCNPAEGGTTPSVGTILLALELTSIPVYVLIRPRGGNFVYNNVEFESMLRDIAELKKIGIAGFVCGSLNNDGTVNTIQTKALIEACSPLPLRFHRAIDMCKDYIHSIGVLADAGVRSILTSGSRQTAYEGKMILSNAQKMYGNKIEIVAAGKIDASNAAFFLEEGISYLHAALLTKRGNGIKSLLNYNLNTGDNSMEYYATDTNRLRLLTEVARKYNGNLQ